MYLTFSEFQALCPDSTVTAEQFPALEGRAEADIDALTFNRITAQGFDALTGFQKDRVRRSVALHLSFVADNQELLDSPLSAYSISGVSMSFDRSKIVTVGGVTTSAQVYSCLMKTGLCYRGLSG